MLRFPLAIQVEMSGGPLWLEDSRWRKGEVKSVVEGQEHTSGKAGTNSASLPRMGVGHAFDKEEQLHSTESSPCINLGRERGSRLQTTLSSNSALSLSILVAEKYWADFLSTIWPS